MNNIDILEEKEKEAIKDLEEYLHWEELQGFSMLPRDKHIETLLNLVETLIAENKELKEEKEELKIIKSGIQTLETNFANDDTYYVIGKRGFFKGEYRKLLDDYIPKSKVEEKIEELEKDENLINAEYFIKILQSLLGKE